MAKKTRRAAAADATAGENPRRPCPCGSGKRYKACHGAGDDVIVTRPFAGLAAECELVAMREFLPSATAPLPTARRTAGHRRDRAARRVGRARPAERRGPARHAGADALRRPVRGPRARRCAGRARPSRGRRCRSCRRPGATRCACRTSWTPTHPLDLTIHADFTWWLTPEDAASPSAEVAATLERANAVIMPTEAVVGGRRARGVLGRHRRQGAPALGAPGAGGARSSPRWPGCRPRGELDLGEGSRYVGSFRAHGLLVPVWDLDRELHAKEWAEPAAAFAARLDGRWRTTRRSPTPSAGRGTRWRASRSPCADRPPERGVRLPEVCGRPA